MVECAVVWSMYDTYCKKCLNAGSDAMHLSGKFVNAKMSSLQHSTLFHWQTWMSACLTSTTAPTTAPTLRVGSSATAARVTYWMRTGHSARVSYI